MATITHACGHKARYTLTGTAASRSSRAFALSLRNCPSCDIGTLRGRTPRILTRDGSATRDHELLVTRSAPVMLCVSCGEVLCDDGEDDLDAGLCLSCQCD